MARVRTRVKVKIRVWARFYRYFMTDSIGKE